MRDQFSRPLGSLRISVTDRCNLRCQYCMPEDEYRWLPRQDLLNFEELTRLVGIFQVSKVRLTGGEPLLRRNLSHLVAKLAELGLQDLALTTNGVLLEGQAQALREAGLHRLSVSLDSLRPERFLKLARRDNLAQVVAGIDKARQVGFGDLKLDTVVIRGENEDELADMLEFAREREAEVRFIEYMDVGGATRWKMDKVFSRAQMLESLEHRYGAIEPLPGRGAAPAERFRLKNGATFGIIASVTAPFCAVCDRARLTADGKLFTCLYAFQGLDLRGPLREGASDAEMRELLVKRWQARRDRGAEERASLPQREALGSVELLRLQPHLEMHTRGG